MLKTLVTIGALQIVTMLFQLVRTKTLALLLGPEMVGAMSVIDKLLAVIVQTVSLSLPFAALRFLPERWSIGPGEYRALFRKMRNLLLLLILLTTAGALAVNALRPAVWGAQLLPYRGALTAALLGLPVLGLIPFLQNAIAGRLEQNRAMLIGLLNAVVLALAAAGVWWRGLPGYYIAYAGLGLVLAAAVSRIATRGTPAPAAAPAPGSLFGLPPALWRFSTALIVLTFLSPYAALFVHYHLLRDHGAATAGWMAAAAGIGLSVRTVIGSAHSVFLTPNVNRGGSADDRMAWANRFQRVFCLIAGLVVPPLLLFPGLAVRLLYSSAFLPGAAFVTLFVLLEVVNLLSGTYQSLVIALDRMGVHVANNLASQLLVVAVASQLVKPLGILGAGLALLAAPIFMTVATLIFLSRAYRLRVPAGIVLLSASVVLALTAAGLTGAYARGALVPVLLIKGAVYAAIVGGFFALLTADERRRLRETLGGWRRRLFPAAS